MNKIYRVQAPDGAILQIEGPVNASQEQVLQAAQAAFAQRQTPSSTPTQEPAQQSGFLDRLQDRIRNSSPVQTVFGGLRGAGSIGATLLTPYDMAVGNTQSWSNPERRQAIEGGLREIGANPESMSYRAGKLATEMAGTAGTGGILANTLRLAPAAVQAAPAVQGLATALRTGGMAGPSLMSRVAGGAATGAAAAGMINPEEASTGAMVGGALPMVGPAVRGVGTGIRKAIGGTTGVGDDALREAFQAGRAGGAQAEALRSGMRGQADMLSVLDDAKANLEALRQSRAAAYRQNMAGVRADKTVLDMTPIEKSLQESVEKFTFKGQARNPRAMAALENVAEEVQNWRQLDPTEFHTPEGLDALKQRISAIRESLPFEDRSARAAVDGVFASIKREIEKQAPDYATAMRDYSQASELIDEITRSLSLNDRATADTAMRKLQSVMRNNANTNYGARLASVEALEQAGGRPLMPQLAGQALNEWTPRGIQRATAGTGSAGLALTGNVPAALGMAAVSSPRLMGEAMLGAGRVAGMADQMVNPELVRMLREGAYRSAPVIAAQ